MKISIVLSTHQAQFQAVAFKGDWAANLERIAALGYDGVELAIRDPRLVDAPALLAAARAHRLSISAIGTGQAWGEEGLSFTDPDETVRQAAIERICSHVPLAEAAGAAIIIGLIRGLVRPGVAPALAMDWLVDALRQCATAAAAHGVRLAIEPINRYETTLINTVGQCLELIAAVGAPNLGILADTFHMNIEEPSIHASLRQAGRRLFHVHFADSNRWYPGGGHLDFAAILQTLCEVGYDGYVSIEALPLPDAETCAARSMQTWRQLETSRSGQ